jgi:hypothetical protein
MYEPSWGQLVAALGQPVPYWARNLIDERLIQAWRPGTDPVVIPPKPPVDVAILAQLADSYDDEQSPARLLLLNLGAVIRARAVQQARLQIRTASDGTSPDDITIAAYPAPVPDADPTDLPEIVRRAGWLDILERTDALTAVAVSETTKWQGIRDMPYGATERITADTDPAREWAARLVPVTTRTAAFNLVDSPTDDAMFVDPVTGAPAVLRADWSTDDGAPTYLAAIPNRLAATSPLAEVILSGPVWIRTGDRTIYPAPRDPKQGAPTWGYAGTGPSTLATIIARLLDDITATGADTGLSDSSRLQELTRATLPVGTILTRDYLEDVRAGKANP